LAIPGLIALGSTWAVFANRPEASSKQVQFAAITDINFRSYKRNLVGVSLGIVIVIVTFLKREKISDILFNGRGKQAAQWARKTTEDVKEGMEDKSKMGDHSPQFSENAGDGDPKESISRDSIPSPMPAIPGEALDTHLQPDRLINPAPGNSDIGTEKESEIQDEQILHKLREDANAQLKQLIETCSKMDNSWVGKMGYESNQFPKDVLKSYQEKTSKLHELMINKAKRSELISAKSGVAVKSLFTALVRNLLGNLSEHLSYELQYLEMADDV
jgi:hypothetical protein